MRTEISVDIDRPIDQVFEKTLHDVTAWSITCVEDEVIEETPEGVGTKFRIVTEDRGKQMTFDGVVTEQETPHRSRIYMTHKSLDLDVLYTFEEIPSGTRVTQNSHAIGKGVFKIMLPLMGWMMKKSTCDAQQNELHSLKKYCEEQIPTAQA